MIQLATIHNNSYEKTITEYKRFYKNYLINIKDRDATLKQLHLFIQRYKLLEPNTYLTSNPELIRLDIEISDFLNEKINKQLQIIYDKDYSSLNSKNITQKQFENLLADIFVALFQALKDDIELKKNTWKYRLKILNYIYSCLNDYGLHENIERRTISQYNLMVKHKFHRKNSVKEFLLSQSYEQLNETFISQYKEQLPIILNGKLIPFHEIIEVQITRVKYLEDEIELFAKRNNFIWLNNRKDFHSFMKFSTNVTDKYLPNPYKQSFSFSLIEETERLLNSYPKSFNLYKSALDKFEKNNLERNLIDDLRLSIELLLKEVLKNQCPLEKQQSHLGNYLKTKGSKKEITNTFISTLDCFSKFQNNHVKHDFKELKNDVQFIVNISSTFICYILKQ